MSVSWLHSAILIFATIRHTNGFEKLKVLDETQFSNPLSFDYSFDDETARQVDKNDIYDELVPFLPSFSLHKNGVDMGHTRLQYVTRKSPVWSTPTTRPPYMPPYHGWHTTPAPRHREPTNFEYNPNSLSAAKKKSKTEIPITVDAKEEIGQNLHFTKFAQRFGVNRVVSPVMEPATATLRVTTTTPRVTTTTARLSSARDEVRNGVISGRSIQMPKVSLKPLMIDTEDFPYQGPTFNCPVLTPKEDSTPSEQTNPSCKMKEPGVSSDGKCRCTYEVTERDEDGCALSYVYTCLPR